MGGAAREVSSSHAEADGQESKPHKPHGKSFLHRLTGRFRKSDSSNGAMAGRKNGHNITSSDAKAAVAAATGSRQASAFPETTENGGSWLGGSLSSLPMGSWPLPHAPGPCAASSPSLSSPSSSAVFTTPTGGDDGYGKRGNAEWRTEAVNTTHQSSTLKERVQPSLLSAPFPGPHTNDDAPSAAACNNEDAPARLSRSTDCPRPSQQPRSGRSAAAANRSSASSSSPIMSSHTASASSGVSVASRKSSFQASKTSAVAAATGQKQRSSKSTITAFSSYSTSTSSSSSSKSSSSIISATVDILSRGSQRSQAASSRLAEPGSPHFPLSAGGVGAGGGHVPARLHDDGFVMTRDHRSTLVSTVDVEVAMAKRMMQRQQSSIYLQARWSHMRKAEADQRALYASAAANGAPLDPDELPVNVDSAHFWDVKARTDTMYTRNMDALVELYLSSLPMYREALARFRAHLPRDEQRLRTSDIANAYRRATETGCSDLTKSANGGGGGGSFAGLDGDRTGTAAASRSPDGRWWQLQKEDVDLLGADAARRARLLDDTLPWRPINFNSTNIQLEPLEHHYQYALGEAHGAPHAATKASGTGSRAVDGGSPHAAAVVPAIGGSVNLLLEVLILTETDPPYVSGVPAVSFTNSFIVLASSFVMPDVLVVKFIRLFRAIRRWGAEPAECDDEHRPAYLMRRLLCCLIAYCRYHEMDLTLAVVQRIAYFVECCGYANPLAAYFPRKDTTNSGGRAAAGDGSCSPPTLFSPAVDEWPCTEGVYDARRTEVQLAAVTAAGITRGPSTSGLLNTAVGPSVTAVSFGPADSVTFVESLAHVGGGGANMQARRPLPPLDANVSQVLMELSLFTQQFFEQHYRLSPVVAPYAAAGLAGGNAARVFSPWTAHVSVVEGGQLPPSEGSAATGMGNGPAASAAAGSGAGAAYAVVESGVPRYRLGTMYTAAAAARRTRTAVGGSGLLPPASPSTRVPIGVSGRSRLSTSTLGDEDAEDGKANDDSGDRNHMPGIGYSRSGRSERRGTSFTGDSGRSAGYRGAASGSPPNGGPASSHAFMAKGPCACTPAAPHAQIHSVDIDAELFANQLSLLVFSLFSSVHQREIMHNAWTDPDMQRCVSFHLHELIEYNTRLQRWTAAVVVMPDTWQESQRAMRHLLEVCRRLYEQQNYQTASAMLGGLRHPAVEVAEKSYAAAHGESMLPESEQREMETLQDLMDPFASYSPSSLNSVMARAASDTGRPMIPLLSPILGVLFRTEDSKGRTVTVRASDGQAVVNWSKIMAISKIVALWLRCQYTPYAYPPDPTLQEYLWSIRYHQWTDSMLIRVARRVKTSAAEGKPSDA